MRLGIIELKDSHYTLIYSLVHIYNCEGNEILIFTTPLIQKYLGDLLKAENVRFVIKNDGDSQITITPRLHACTSGLIDADANQNSHHNKKTN